MLSLSREGNMDPGAAAVAERAGVGLRSVFRHFSEMDVLYAAISQLIEAEVRPLLSEPLAGRTWREKLDSAVTRRAQVYERIMPMKVAGALRRFQSDFLMQDYERFLDLECAGLRAILPMKVNKDNLTVSALEMCMGFPAWRRLRQDQRLSPREAEAVRRFAVSRVIGEE
jgi:AcrR family transcriptional regulator